MKKLYSLLIFTLITSVAFAQFPLNVTLTIEDENMAINGANFKGSYDGWATTLPGSDDGATNGDMTANDFIYTFQAPITAAGTYEWGAEDNDAVWLLVGGNPSFTVDASGNVTGQTDYTIPLMGASFPVLLTVTDTNGEYDSLCVKGAYDGWSCARMYDDGTNGDVTAGDDVHSLMVMAAGGATYEWGADNLGCDPSAWIIVGPNNSFDIDMSGNVTGDVNYSTQLATAQYPVTFRVDMNNEIVESSGVHVAGNFQACPWTKDVLELTDGDGDGIYTITAPVSPGVFQYKFYNGDCGDNGCNENADFETLGCGVPNGLGEWNREIDLSGMTAATVLDAFIYNSCTATLTGINDLNSLELFSTTPNPFSTETLIQFDNSNSDIFTLSLVNLRGQLVKQMNNIEGNSVLLTRDDLPTGIYMATLRNSKGQFVSKKLVVE